MLLPPTRGDCQDGSESQQQDTHGQDEQVPDVRDRDERAGERMVQTQPAGGDDRGEQEELSAAENGQEGPPEPAPAQAGQAAVGPPPEADGPQGEGEENQKKPAHGVDGRSPPGYYADEQRSQHERRSIG